LLKLKLASTKRKKPDRTYVGIDTARVRTWIWSGRFSSHFINFLSYEISGRYTTDLNYRPNKKLQQSESETANLRQMQLITQKNPTIGDIPH